MNGCGHLLEDFAAPPTLCPVDLSKLAAVLGPSCDLAARYRALLAFCEGEPAGFGEHAAWLRRALRALDAGGRVAAAGKHRGNKRAAQAAAAAAVPNPEAREDVDGSDEDEDEALVPLRKRLANRMAGRQ